MMDQVCDRFSLPAADWRSFAEQNADATREAALADLDKVHADLCRIMAELDDATGDGSALCQAIEEVETARAAIRLEMDA